MILQNTFNKDVTIRTTRAILNIQHEYLHQNRDSISYVTSSQRLLFETNLFYYRALLEPGL